MTTLHVSTNAREVGDWLLLLFKDQIPFATAKAINRVMIESQRVQRRHMESIFEVRRPAFVLRAVKIRREDFANKRKIEGIIRIEPPGGLGRADILTKFETLRRKHPIFGSRLAVPDQVKRTKTGVIRKSERPGAFDFKLHASGPGGQVFKGKRRTWMILRPGGRGEIYQRTGRRRTARTAARRASGRTGTVRRLFQFVPDAPIEPNLNFEVNVTRTSNRWMPSYWEEEFDKAIASAKSVKTPNFGGGFLTLVAAA